MMRSTPKLELWLDVLAIHLRPANTGLRSRDTSLTLGVQELSTLTNLSRLLGKFQAADPLQQRRRP